jgi:hypothetical protein
MERSQEVYMSFSGILGNKRYDHEFWQDLNP